jgi:DNA-binding GntR family transcriptional regulator
MSVDAGPIVERLAGEIADAIMVGELPLGSWLRQEQLARRFGVSRQPIREALHRLELIGMVEALPRRGARVTGPAPASIREGYLIRAELEGLAAQLAAERMTPDQLRELRSSFAGFRAEIILEVQELGSGTPPLRRWLAHHNRFHELIHEGSGVERLAALIRTLSVALPRNLTTEAIRETGQLDENIRQHEVILSALELRSPPVAREAMEHHVRRSGELIATWFERPRGERARSEAVPGTSPGAAVA